MVFLLLFCHGFQLFHIACDADVQLGVVNIALRFLSEGKILETNIQRDGTLLFRLLGNGGGNNAAAEQLLLLGDQIVGDDTDPLLRVQLPDQTAYAVVAGIHQIYRADTGIFPEEVPQQRLRRPIRCSYPPAAFTAPAARWNG